MKRPTVTRRPQGRRVGLQPEERLHVAVAQFLRLALRPPTYWTTIGHGSRIGLRESLMLKRKGLQPGFPDVLIFHPLGTTQTIVVGLELKSKAGRLSMDQIETGERLRRCNIAYAVCRSVDDVRAGLAQLSIPLYAKLMGAGIYAPASTR